MKKKENERKFFFRDTEENPVTESYRLLRTSINFMNEKNKVIIVTSTIPKEGKSSVATNYALSEVIAGKKVLLIDSDIRRPRIHQGLELQFEKGLSDLLLGKAQLSEVIIKNSEKNFDVIPANHFKGNITEMFLTEKLSQTITQLKKVYDLIIIDTPPLAVATDALILSKHGDGIIYVVGYDMVTKKELEYGKNLIDRAGAKLYGLIVNKVDKSGYSFGNYGYYNYNYQYYDSYVNKNKD